jgi:hypothetical protein
MSPPLTRGYPQVQWGERRRSRGGSPVDKVWASGCPKWLYTWRPPRRWYCVRHDGEMRQQPLHYRTRCRTAPWLPAPTALAKVMTRLLRRTLATLSDKAVYLPPHSYGCFWSTSVGTSTCLRIQDVRLYASTATSTAQKVTVTLSKTCVIALTKIIKVTSIAQFT